MIKIIEKIVSLFSVKNSHELSVKYENFTWYELEFAFRLESIPDPSILMSYLPEISSRDQWYMRMTQSEADDDIFEIHAGVDISSSCDRDRLETYVNCDVRLNFRVEKQKVLTVLSIYDLPLFCHYLKDLAVYECINAIHNNLDPSLILEVWGDSVERFSTNSFAVIAKGEKLPKIGENLEFRDRYDQCTQQCHWITNLPCLLPDDLFIVSAEIGGELMSIFNQLCLLVSSYFVADFSDIQRELIEIKISGFKALKYRSISNVLVGSLCFNEDSSKQWYKIYDWCYIGGYRSEKISLARNIISLNCSNIDTLQLNDSTLSAIQSNFLIFERDNVRQYIKVRNEVSKILLDLQEKVNSIVESFTGDFRKNVLTIGSFFLTVVVVRLVSKGDVYGCFTTNILLLSYFFILLSAVNLVYSRFVLDKKTKLFQKHYAQLRERYSTLLSKEELDKIFEDCDPNRLESHGNYIQWQKKRYTWIWALSLVALSILLLVMWSYNFFETSNFFVVLKAIVSCCIKSI